MDGSLLFVCVSCGKGLSDYDDFIAHTEGHEQGQQDEARSLEIASDFSQANSRSPELNDFQSKNTYCKVEADPDIRSSAEPKAFNIRDIEQTCNAILELAASRKDQDAVKGDFITKKERQTLQEASKLILLNKLYKDEKIDVTRKRKTSPIDFQSKLERQICDKGPVKFPASNSYSHKAEATIHYRATPPVHRPNSAMVHGVPLVVESSTQNIEQAVHDVMAASGLPTLQYLPGTRHSPEVPRRWNHVPVSPPPLRFYPQSNCHLWPNWYLSRPHVSGHNPNFAPTVHSGFVHYAPINQQSPQLYKHYHYAAGSLPCTSPLQIRNQYTKNPTSHPSGPRHYTPNPFIRISDVRSLSLSTNENREHCARSIDIQVGLCASLSEFSSVMDSSDGHVDVLQGSAKHSVPGDLPRTEGISKEAEEKTFAHGQRLGSTPSEVMVEHAPSSTVLAPEDAGYFSIQEMSLSSSSSFHSEWSKRERPITTACGHRFPEITSYFHLNTDKKFDLDQSTRDTEIRDGANCEVGRLPTILDDSHVPYRAQDAMTRHSEMLVDNSESPSLIHEIPEVSVGETQYFSEPIVANVYSLVHTNDETESRQPNEAVRIEERLLRNADSEAIVSHIHEPPTRVEFSSLHAADTSSEIKTAPCNASSLQMHVIVTTSVISSTPSISKVKTESLDDEVTTDTCNSTASKQRGTVDLRPVTKKEPEEEFERLAEEQQLVEEGSCGPQVPCDSTEKLEIINCNEKKGNVQMAHQVSKWATENKGKLLVTVRLSEDAVKQEPNVSGEGDSFVAQPKKAVSKASSLDRHCSTDLYHKDISILKSLPTSQSTQNKALTHSWNRVVHFGPQKRKDGGTTSSPDPVAVSSVNSPESVADNPKWSKNDPNQRLKATVIAREEVKEGSLSHSSAGDSTCSTHQKMSGRCQKEKNENEADEKLTTMQQCTQTTYPAAILDVAVNKVSSATPEENRTRWQMFSRSPKRQAIDDRGVNRENELSSSGGEAFVEAVCSQGRVKVSFDGDSAANRSKVTQGQGISVDANEKESLSSPSNVFDSNSIRNSAHSNEPGYSTSTHRVINEESRKQKSHCGAKTSKSASLLSGCSPSVTVPCVPQPCVVTQVLPAYTANILSSVGKEPVGGSFLVGSNVVQAPLVVAYEGSYFLQVGNVLIPMGPTMYPLLLPKQSVGCTLDKREPSGVLNPPLVSVRPEVVPLPTREEDEDKQTRKLRKRNFQSDEDYQPEMRDSSAVEDGDKIVCRRCQSFFEDNLSWIAHAEECSRKKYNFRKRTGSYSKFYGSDQSSGDEEKFE